MIIEKSTTLRNIGFNAIMKYKKLQRIGKGSFFEVNKVGGRFVIQKKSLINATC